MLLICINRTACSLRCAPLALVYVPCRTHRVHLHDDGQVGLGEADHAPSLRHIHHRAAVALQSLGLRLQEPERELLLVHQQPVTVLARAPMPSRPSKPLDATVPSLDAQRTTDCARGFAC